MTLIERYERYINKMEHCQKELQNELEDLSRFDLTHDELGYFGYITSTINELIIDIAVAESAIERLKKC